MKIALISALLLAGFASVSSAQAPQAAPATGPVTTEFYFRIKWGSMNEFKRLFERNHAPIMREMQKQGFMTKIEIEEPYTHLAGGPRWDLRVTVTFRDAASAVFPGGEFYRAFEEAQARLYPDKKTFEAEEARRYSLVEEHWDVIVVPVRN